jgi:hypothetical protein
MRKPPTVGPHCHEVKITKAGYVWHFTRGEQACINCNDSANLYSKYNAAVKGERVLVTLDDMKSFALAWMPDEENINRAADVALRAMLIGLT